MLKAKLVMQRILLILSIILVSFWAGWYLNTIYRLPSTPPFIPKPLERYTIENLAKRTSLGSEIKISQKNLFSFTTEGKKVTGQINIPEGHGAFPLVLMLRGYVDQKVYETGDGTKRVAEVFVKNGFIAVAPDFLGYGGSDPQSQSIFEARLQTYTTTLDLIDSLKSISKWDNKNLFIWGHSNGGQIALTILEITQGTYPTVLWAPVSKPFPYSVLYYTDQSEDLGRLIRRELARFEELYDPDLYSIHSYYDRIKAPIQLHQGTVDNAVPVAWSDVLEKTLRSRSEKDKEIEIEYYKYSGGDHNLNPFGSEPQVFDSEDAQTRGGRRPSWDLAVSRSLAFFRNQLNNE